ncbi:carboxylesterase family protein [Colletotrichum truncatum]|uniref:Carboxylesterase family protein n=1 Tax=Colletotrichum truncatum TaxID=5467 RepID=A0ACC3YYA3_COLTU
MRDSRIAFRHLSALVLLLSVVVLLVDTDKSKVVMKSLKFIAASVAAALPFSLGAPSLPRSEDAASAFLSEVIAEVKGLDDDNLHGSCANPLKVDLGYAKYEGYTNTTSGLNSWRGIRYAAPPVGALRWQPPQPPSPDLFNGTTAATEFGSICPQNFPVFPGLPPFIPASEDCLFLNVYAPPNAKDLPVMVYIHGGGYGYGDGLQDMSALINDNGNSFIVVVIQYRLGAFGFLSSADIKSRGAVNAGLLDQVYALRWVHKFIHQFGGDRKRVTIAGGSAGASSIMYHALAADGTLGSLFFTNARSPYLPFQYDYDAGFPTQRYTSFAEKAGCASASDVLECLRGKDSMTLQVASGTVNSEQAYGYWAFYPVTDGVYVKNRASEQLSQKKVNGERLLVGTAANEGALFVRPNIVTLDDLKGWLKLEFPNFSEEQIEEVLAANPTKTGANDTRFDTNGLTGLTALDVSQAGTGQLQRGYNIYAEATFVCPSYWFATAFTSPKSAWHYQYSIPFASHTTDFLAYFGPATPNQGPDFALAGRRIWGNFVTKNDPSISNEIANGASSEDPTAENGASEWPEWTETEPKQLNLNQTGGVAYQEVMSWGASVTQFRAPGQKNAFAVVPADSWEGGRGERCEFWKKIAPRIPS